MMIGSVEEVIVLGFGGRLESELILRLVKGARVARRPACFPRLLRLGLPLPGAEYPKQKPLADEIQCIHLKTN